MPASDAPLLAESIDDLDTKDFSALLVSIRRYLHMHPELGFEEHHTATFIRNKLESYGLTVQGPLAETGLYVDIVGDHPGPTVGYRADIDALPIQDAKQVPYASQTPCVAHLCGHDAHTAVGIGVALLLDRLRPRLHGTARVFFQPNEEGAPSGAVAMIRDGVLEGLDAVYCIHVDPTLDAGRYGLLVGPVTAAADRLTIRVRGRTTGHSARPHQSKDTIWIASQLLGLLYQYAGRITDARHAAVLTICMFHGGDAHNVIPAEVEFGGTLRCTDPQDRERIKQYIRHTAEQFAALHDVSIAVEFSQGVPAVNNDERLIENARETIEAMHGEDAVYDIPLPSMGSEDFAHYLEHIPGALLRVGTRSGKRTAYPLHDAAFDIDESVLAPAARLLACVLVHHLQQHSDAEYAG